MGQGLIVICVSKWNHHSVKIFVCVCLISDSGNPPITRDVWVSGFVLFGCISWFDPIAQTRSSVTRQSCGTDAILSLHNDNMRLETGFWSSVGGWKWNPLLTEQQSQDFIPRRKSSLVEIWRFKVNKQVLLCTLELLQLWRAVVKLNGRWDGRVIPLATGVSLQKREGSNTSFKLLQMRFLVGIT